MISETRLVSRIKGPYIQNVSENIYAIDIQACFQDTGFFMFSDIARYLNSLKSAIRFILVFGRVRSNVNLGKIIVTFPQLR